ncbi:hypothetical protein MKX54_07760 [Alkalihalobacillus sp. FSL R5-0424]
MKRLFICVALILVIAGIVSDLRTGSLPDQSVKQQSQSTPPKKAEVPADSSPSLASQEVIVEPGHTVLSVVEHLNEGPIPVSIAQIIDDFKSLNQSLEPDMIQTGETYLFPIYKKE